MRAHERRVGLIATLWFLTLLFAFIAANLLWATLLVLPAGTALVNPRVHSLRGEEAADKGWPSEKIKDWPEHPKVIEIWETSGRRILSAWTKKEDGGTFEPHFQMIVFEYGWPMPVIEQSHRSHFFPGLPAFSADGASPVPPGLAPDFSASAASVRWGGLVAPAVGGAAFVWCLTAGIWLGIRMRRRWKHRCVECAYPHGTAPCCTECGTIISR